MTPSEALSRWKEIRPEHASKLGVDLEISYGYIYASKNYFKLWDYTLRLEVFTSQESWEDALGTGEEGRNQ